MARQLLTEGVVVALAGAALAMPLQAAAARALRENMPAEIVRFLPGWQHLGADWRTLAFSALLAVLAAGVFSALPAWRASRLELNEVLREGGRSVAGGGRRQRGANLLVVAQVAGALSLVATAGVAVRSADALLNGRQGYEPRGVLAFDVALSDARYSEAGKRRTFVREVEARLAELAGVEGVGAANTLPGRGGFSSRPIEIEGQPLARGQEAPIVEARSATPGLFDTLRLPLERGRSLEETDTADTDAVTVVSRSMAERFWPGQDAIGKRFRLAGEDSASPWLRIVGVTGDVIHQWVLRRNAPTFYRPLAQAPPQRLAFAVRAGGDPEALAAAVRHAVAAVDPDQPVYQLRSLRRSIAQSTIGLQYVAAIMAAFGVLALVLAVGGVYGVMAQRVSRRTLEIGVRVALGATRVDVLRLTLGQALRLSAIGLLLGAGLAYGTSRALAATLRGAVAFDLGVLALATALLSAAALAAAFIPARRALAVDPARALRAN